MKALSVKYLRYYICRIDNNILKFFITIDGCLVHMISNVEDKNRVVLPGKGVYLVRQGVRSKEVVN